MAAGSLAGQGLTALNPVPAAAMMASTRSLVSSSVMPGGAVERADDGMFYVVGIVNGARVRFLVDTGANVVVLTDEDARRVGARAMQDHPGGELDTANGAASTAWVKLNRIEVAGRAIADVDAAVPHGNLKVSLLGQNVLSQLGGLSINGERLTLR